MKAIKFIVLSVFLFLISACASLKPVTYTGDVSLAGYKYAYITPTSAISSTTGGVYRNAYGLYGSTSSRSINPADIMSGILIKNGFTILPELDDGLKGMTIIINYGETGREYVFFGYALEITLQILAADTLEVLCTITAEGMGETEVDGIRIAITRAMEVIFPN